MPYSPIKVANEFLRLAREGEPPRSLTALKLIKLVYIAHGWSLVYLPEPLVNEPAQAWQYGPVVPSLYHAVKRFGGRPIIGPLQGDTDPQLLSVAAVGLIVAVYEAYGHLSAVQLSNMTHLPDTPWSDVWDNFGRNAEIPNELIQRHYQVLQQRRVAAE